MVDTTGAGTEKKDAAGFLSFLGGGKPADKGAAGAKSGGLFGGGAKPAVPGAHANLNEITTNISNISRRVRVIEERHVSLRERLNVTDKNMLGSARKLRDEMKASVEQVKDVWKEVESIKDDIKLIIKDLQTCAKQQDLNVLEKYVQMWEPIKYVSRSEVSRMIKEQVEQEMISLNLKVQEEKYIDEQVERTVRKILRERSNGGV
jgi:hypothetical protein